MTFMRIGPPVVVFGSQKAGISTKGRQEAVTYLSTFQPIVSGEAEQ